MKCLVMKLIWYLPTWGQKCTRREAQQILFGKFDLGHPVIFIYFPSYSKTQTKPLIHFTITERQVM